MKHIFIYQKNVEGPYCDRCKDGFFNLQLQNKDGCTKCFCNGLSQSCRSAKLERKQVIKVLYFPVITV